MRGCLSGCLLAIAYMVAIVAMCFATSCNGRPSSSWLTQPQFTVGVWEVHHPFDLKAHELAWIRQSIAAHIYLSQRTLPTSPNNLAPRWIAKLPNTTPKIYVYDQKVKALNSPIRIGVTAYADFRREQIHCVLGQKVSMPGLAAAVHQLRVGPDPWHQDLALGWGLLFPAQDALVDGFIKSR